MTHFISKTCLMFSSVFSEQSFLVVTIFSGGCALCTFVCMCTHAYMCMFKCVCMSTHSTAPKHISLWAGECVWMHRHRGIGMNYAWSRLRFWKSVSFSVPIIVSRGTTGEPEFPHDGRESTCSPSANANQQLSLRFCARGFLPWQILHFPPPDIQWALGSVQAAGLSKK